jgi:hypothetical protein
MFVFARFISFFFLFVCLFVKAYEFGLLDLIESGCNPYR